MDDVADGIVALDRRGLIVSFSRSAEAIFGYRENEIVGRSVDVLVVRDSHADSDPLDRILAAAKLPGSLGEVVARRKGGELIPIGMSASEGTLNDHVCYILTIRDRTIRRRTE